MRTYTIEATPSRPFLVWNPRTETYHECTGSAIIAPIIDHDPYHGDCHLGDEIAGVALRCDEPGADIPAMEAALLYEDPAALEWRRSN